MTFLNLCPETGYRHSPGVVYFSKVSHVCIKGTPRGEERPGSWCRLKVNAQSHRLERGQEVALSPDPVQMGYISVLPNQLWFCRDFSVGEEIVTHTLVVHKTLCVNGKTKNLTLGRQPPGVLVTHNY